MTKKRHTIAAAFGSRALGSAWAIGPLLLLCCWFSCLGCGKPSRATFAGPTGDPISKTDSNQAEKPPAQQDATPPTIPAPSPELQQQALAATVRVVLADAEGSGVILGRRKDSLYVLTVWHAAKHGIQWLHVFDPLQSLEQPIARLPRPQLVSHNERLDLAVVRVPVSTELKTVRFVLKEPTAKQATANAAELTSAYSTGCSRGEPPTLLRERIEEKAMYRVVNGVTDRRRLMWRTQVPQEEGRSGGALINLDGELIGLALGKKGTSGFYCHFEEIHDYLIDSELNWLVRCEASDNCDE